MKDLTSTDKIVLAYNLGHKRYYASNEHAAQTLGMTLSTVKKSILKLRKLGLWREKASYPSSRDKATRVASKDTRVAEAATAVAHKKSFSPLKTDCLLESRLESNKKKGLESAAGAAKPDIFSDAFSKSKISQDTSECFSKINEAVGATSPSKGAHGAAKQESAHPLVPPTADGTPMTHEDMLEANFRAEFAGQAAPFTEAQLKASRSMRQHAEQIDALDEFERLFGLSREKPALDRSGLPAASSAWGGAENPQKLL